jgi:hypothetical protein
VNWPQVKVVAVLGPSQGTGCLINKHLVLTAAHVVADADEVQVVVPGDGRPRTCRVVWRQHDDARDFALLHCPEHRLVPETIPVDWGWTDELASWPRAQAIGYPQVARDTSGSLDTEQFTGALKLGSTGLRGTYVLDGEHAPPLSRPDGRSPWAGMSGAPVFVQDKLIGVVREEPPGWAHSRLLVSPIRHLLEQGGFARLCQDLDYTLVPRRIPHQRGSDAQEFEHRLRDYLARSAGRLTIIGMGEESLPLDTGYLSLELLGARADSEESSSGRPPALRAEHALAGHRRVLLRGTAGSGKTTLLQWLATVTAQDTPPPALIDDLGDRVPLMLRLRALTRRPELPSPEEFLSVVAKPLCGLPGAEGWVTERLAAGRVLLLIDGVDEVPAADRERTRAWLADLIAAYPDVGYVVTTRPSAVPEGWLAAYEFAEFELLPMSRPDVARFIARWHTAASPGGRPDQRTAALRDAVTSAVAAKPDLGRLATNPLMCALVCALNRDRRGFLPEDRMELYAAALEMLLVRRDRERSIAPVRSGLELSLDQQTLLLQRLAYWLIVNGEAEMSADRARRIIADQLPGLRGVRADPGELLDHLLLRSGLLRQPTLDSVDFVHRTFQDYLGAQALVDNEDLGLLVRNAADDQWRDVLRMAVHHARPRERAELLDRLLELADGGPPADRDRLHLVAAACLEHATSLDPSVRDRVEAAASSLVPPRDPRSAQDLANCGPVVLDLLPGPEELTREEAHAVVATATLLGRERSLPLLARYTRHPSAAVRSRLAGSWSRFEHTQYAEQIITRIDTAPDPTTGALPQFTAASAEELAVLSDLGGRARLVCEGPLTDRELAGLPTAVLSNLDIQDNPYPLDLAILQNAAGLHRLGLLASQGGTDLGPLAGLPLRALILPKDSSVTGLEVLARLPELTVLSLNQRPPNGTSDLGWLPPGVEDLFLGTATVTETLLRGLDGHPGIRRLRIPGEALQPGPDRLPLTTLDGLRRLEVIAEPWPLLRRSPVLPQVEHLTLRGPHRVGDDLALLRSVYPNLNHLDLPPNLIPGPGTDPLPGVSIRPLATAASAVHPFV